MNSKNLFYLAIASLPIALMADIDIEALKARAENSDASAAYELAKHFEEKETTNALCYGTSEPPF